MRKPLDWSDPPSAPKRKGAPPATHTAEQVRDYSVAVYRLRLGKYDTEQMLEKIGEKGLRGHAAGYDALTRAYLEVLGK